MTTENNPAIEALLIHESFLRALTGSILRGDDRVDDVIQETYRTALTRSPDDPNAARSWLAKIAGNLSRRLLLRDAARRRFEGQQRDPSGSLTPGEIAEREETRRRVLAAVMALEEPYRRVILARFYEGLPPREVAKRFDLPVETVRTQTRRGLDRLRSLLDEEWMGNRRARILALVPIAGDSLPTGGLPVAAMALGSLVVLGVLTVVMVGEMTRGVPAGKPETGVMVGTAGAPSAPVPPRRRQEPEPPADQRPLEPHANLTRGTPSVLPGMVEIPAGLFTMGTTERWLKEQFLVDRRRIPPLLNGNKKDLWWGILLRETPAHAVETDAYAIDRYEVTNAQYQAFLDDACGKVMFTESKMNNIYLVATSIYGRNPTHWEMESIYWVNQKKLQSISEKTLFANRELVTAALDSFNEGLPPPAQKQDFADLPLPNRIEAWLRFELPEGTALNTYTRLAPKHWPQAKPAPDELDHPVRFVSGVDADAFAEWAGKHVPTEAEWEKAARGPMNTMYPWGNEWVADDKRQKNLLVWNGADSPPKSPLGDRPVAVDVCPEGQSGYGCFNMLGNVMEWTSSPPLRYPGTAAKFGFWGQRGARALRGLSYGSGKAFLGKELEIRATARILEGPDGAVDERNRYSVLGFRCAKYQTPARDILGHRVRALERSGLLPDGLRFLSRDAFGIEKVEVDADAPHMAFVAGETRAIGLAPAAKTRGEFPAGPAKGDRVLGLLYWTSRLAIEGELPDGEREWLESRALGYVLVLRGSRLALFSPTLDGMGFVAYLPGSYEEVFTTEVRDGEDGHLARLELSPTDETVILGIGRGVFGRGQRLDIPLRVRIPDNEVEGWRGTVEVR